MFSIIFRSVIMVLMAAAAYALIVIPTLSIMGMLESRNQCTVPRTTKSVEAVKPAKRDSVEYVDIKFRWKTPWGI